MKTCRNCGKKLDDTVAFCEQCGTPVTQACSGCGTPLEEGAAFCQNCGKPAEEAVKQPAAAAAYPPAGGAYQSAGGTYQSAGTSYPPVGGTYQSAGATYPPTGPAQPAAAGGPKKFPVKILLIAAAAVVVIAAILVAVFVIKPASNSTLVYLKDDELNITDMKKIEPYELTDGLYANGGSYSYVYYSTVLTSEDGRYLFYPQDIQDDDTFDLYMIDLKASPKNAEAVKIGSGLSEYQISLDGKKVFYLDNDKLYYSDLTNKTKIDSDVYEFYINDAGTKLLYVDWDDTMYYSDSKAGGDVEKLDSDVYIQDVSDDLSKIWYLKDDTLYYLEVGKEKVKIDSDVSSVEAVYDTGEAYYVSSDSKGSTLFYYDGRESTEITDEYYDTMTTGSMAMIVYSKEDKDGWAEGAYVAIGAKETELDQEEAGSFRFSASCAMLYFLDNYSYEDGTAELHAVQIKNGAVGNSEMYDEDVSDAVLWVNQDDAVIYFKDYDSDDNCGDMYVNNNAIDTDVYLYSLTLQEGYYYYLTDIDDDMIGMLKMYDGKKSVKVADDVSSYLTDDDMNVVYITDFDTDDWVGDAYLYNGSREPKPIDKDVSRLLFIK